MPLPWSSPYPVGAAHDVVRGCLAGEPIEGRGVDRVGERFGRPESFRLATWKKRRD